VVSELDSRLEGRGFKSRLMLDGNGVNKPCQDRFSAPNPGSFKLKKRENIGSQMGHTIKIDF